MNRLFDSITSWAGPRKRMPQSVILCVTQLENRSTPAVHGFNVFGAAFGQPPIVTVTRSDGSVLAHVLAYDSVFKGGVSAALGEIDGNPNTIELVTGAGPGGGPHVKVFSINAAGAVAQEASFYAFAPTFGGGVSVAAGDITGDGRAEVVVGAGTGGAPLVRSFIVNPFVNVVQAPGPLGSFFAFAPNFFGGVNVAAGDLNGDGRAEVAVGAGPGGGPHVKVFDGVTGQVIESFYAFPAAFTGGVTLAPIVATGQLLMGAGPTGAFGTSQLTIIGTSTFLNPLTPFLFAPLGVDLLGAGNSSGALVSPLLTSLLGPK
jgi:hypothetical protein